MAAQNFDDLRPHVGHVLECVVYADKETGIEDNVALECLDCGTVLLDFDKEESCVEWSVWTLTITHQYGMDQYIFENEKVAREQLFTYVKDNWKDLFPDEELPDSAAAAIAEYFTDNEGESYVLVNMPVLCEAV